MTNCSKGKLILKCFLNSLTYFYFVYIITYK
nr:MAG TPA: hypothetical protein [Caudoviricetes sp.]